MSTAIVWFRRDLRLADNPALAHAVREHDCIVPIYVHAPQEDGDWAPGAASRWWLAHALEDLSAQLGRKLVVRRGETLGVLRDVAAQTGAVAIYWNRLYEPETVARDTRIKQSLRNEGITAQSFGGALMFEPWDIANRQGNPFKVFTPFWKHLMQIGLPERIDTPEPALLRQRLARAPKSETIKGVPVSELELLPKIPWDAGLQASWQPDRGGAEGCLEEFVATGLRGYASARDRPADQGVSRLSPYLHFGQLSPREVVDACRGFGVGAEPYLRQLGWREFGHHLMFHFPDVPSQSMDRRFAGFPWREEPDALRSWQQGRTGVPLVDAGMRQLWATGWMHNRVRMVVASFLTKNLLLSWHDGARWFWETLVDADLANNSMGWQWVAGCGADAAPYFRVFNPVLQGERYDAEGRYVRQWIPELAGLPGKWIHKPWEAPESVQREAGVIIDRDYPAPIVDLKGSRQRALDVWADLKSAQR